jgi:CubicO group peptidase (beta-lactamase class C family)
MTNRTPPSNVSPPDVVSSLDRLRARAVETRSTAFVAERGGVDVVEAGDVDLPLEIKSITKSVVSLVIGQLVDRGLLALDTSVAEYSLPGAAPPRSRSALLT